MKIVIDCFKLVKGTGKSIGIYNLTKNLVQNLALVNKNRPRNERCKLIILGTELNREDFDLPGVSFIPVKYNPLDKKICLLWETYLVTLAINRIGADKVLFPRGFAPIGGIPCCAKKYVIIHDMIPFYYNKNYYGVLNPLENAYIMERLKASAKSTDTVITDSKASKEDIVSYTKINPDKIKVIYSGQNQIKLALKDNLNNKDNSENTDNKVDFDDIYKPYISAITSMLPHKNAVGIIETYKKYYLKMKERQPESSPLGLKIIGISDLEQYQLPDEISENIECVKYLEKDEDMYQLIKNSRIFLFLSKAEGFGFPPLEAMQLFVPVICSNAASLPEITGDAAILVDPEDTDRAADELYRLSNDDMLRKEMISKGRENTKKFLWNERIKDYERILLG